MGNIVTPDQGWLPLPAYAGAAVSPYPWWLNTALAIWALLGLLCCWFVMLLFLLRYCCQRLRHQQYDANQKSLSERLFGPGDTKGQQSVYVTNNQHFATAPPLPPYAMNASNDITFQNIHEYRIVSGHFYGNRRPYVTTGAIGGGGGGEDHLFESGSEEEIICSVHLLTSGFHPITVLSDKTIDNRIENIEHNITKNYFINEKQNYFIENDESNLSHNQEMQTLPGPIVTTVNMAAERITDDPNWEKTNPIQHDGESSNLKNKNLLDNRSNTKQATVEIVAANPILFQQNVKYEKQPNIHTHRSASPVIERNDESRRKKALAIRLPSVSDDDESTTSEMSGHDSESIYETIRVFTPKKQPLASLKDEDVYKTAGVDEVEIEIKDLVRLQKGNTDNDNLSSPNMTRRHNTSALSSSSSSSTLQNLMVSDSQNKTNPTAGISNEETVTETIQTQQIQTSFRQLGQQIEDSAFFIPLSSSSIRHDEKSALHYHRDH